MARMIRPAEARTLRYPFVALPVAGPSGGYEIVFPDIANVTSYADTLEAVPHAVRECLDGLFADQEAAGYLVEAPGDYSQADAITLDAESAPTQDPEAALASAAEVAERLGITKQAVHVASRKLGAGRMVGNQRLYTAWDVERLSQRQPVGRPRARD